MMLPEIVSRASYITKKNPCKLCIVRPCCDQKCKPLQMWEGRYDLIKSPFIIMGMIVAIPMFTLVVGIMIVLSLTGAIDFREMFNRLFKLDYYNNDYY